MGHQPLFEPFFLMAFDVIEDRLWVGHRLRVEDRVQVEHEFGVERKFTSHMVKTGGWKVPFAYPPYLSFPRQSHQTLTLPLFPLQMPVHHLMP